MPVRGVWYSEDRRLRVELVAERGREFFRVIDRSLPVAQLPSVERLEEWLREHAGVGFADLVED
ncbi:MAG TPA: hypothetical protein VJT31_12485 [Rugosimonospora sp.]|nr:hypothetical protein [Rugosimonospora sp.]